MLLFNSTLQSHTISDHNTLRSACTSLGYCVIVFIYGQLQYAVLIIYGCLCIYFGPKST